MAFYKRDGETLHQAPNFVHGPGFSLTVENHAEHSYPVDGWYWFDTLDEAMTALISPPDVPTVSALQALLALDKLGLASEYEAWASDPARTFSERAFINKAQTWRRDDQTFNSAADALGKSESERDAFFQLAVTL